MPREGDLRRAAEVLNEGKKVAILVGAGALQATDEVIAVADKLQAGVAKALLGKAALARRTALGDRLDRTARHQTELGHDDGLRHAADDRVRLSLFGVPAERGTGAGRPDRPEPDMLSLRYPMEVNLVGDSAETLKLLLPMLEQKRERSWRTEIEKNVADWWKTLEERAMAPANPVNPQRVTWELSPRLPERVHHHQRFRVRARTGMRAI